ncbi:hypothetical protein MHYP_G00267790 [Metynnis hypsauchen]
MSNCFQIEGAHRLLSVLYMYWELTLSCSVVQAPAMTLPPADELPPVPPAPQASVDHLFSHDYADAHDHPRSPTVAPKSTAPTSTASATASSTPTKASAHEQLWYAYPYDYARPWPFYHSPPRAPPNSPTVAPKSTGSTTTALTTSMPTKAGADQPAKSPKVSPETTAPTTIVTKVKPPSDQQLSYHFPWLPGVPSEKDQKHSVPVDAASAGSQSSPFTGNGDDPQPVYPRQKWYYPMYQSTQHAFGPSAFLVLLTSSWECFNGRNERSSAQSSQGSSCDILQFVRLVDWSSRSSTTLVWIECQSSSMT